MIVEPKCEECPLKGSTKVYGYGNRKSEIVFVAESPGSKETEVGIPLVGSSGKKFDRLLKKIGIRRDDVYVTNVLLCQPEGNRNPTAKEIECCKERLLSEIRMVSPRLVVCLGSFASKVLAGISSVQDAHGWYIEDTPCGHPCLIAFHPAATFRQWELDPLLEFDFRMIPKVLNGFHYEYPRCFVVKRREDVKKLCDRLRGKVIAVDSETSGYDWRTERILCISLSCNGRVGYVIPFDDLDDFFDILRDFFQDESTHFIGQNIAFDLRFLKRAGLEIKNVVFDTMIAQHLVDENFPRSLTNMSKFYTPFGPYELEIKKYVPSKTKGSFADIPEKVLWKYAATDACATYLCYKHLRRELKRQNLVWLFENIALPLSLVLSEVTYRGVRVDKQAIEETIEKLDLKIKEEQEKLYKIAGEFNYRSTKQLGEVLFKKLGLKSVAQTATGSPSTSAKVLEKLSKDHEVPSIILNLRKMEKLKNTFLVNLRKMADENSRVHTDYLVTGTTGARLSSRNPNLQNIPRDSIVRGVFRVEKGWKLIQCDFERAELWCMAWLSRDKKLLGDLKSQDFHTLNAYNLGITPPDRKPTREERMRAKMFTFGMCYSASAQGLSQSMGIPESLVRDYMDRFFSTYPKVKQWMNEQKRKVRRGEPVVTPQGRRRHFYGMRDVPNRILAEAERQAINFPAQSLTADATNLATIRIHERLKEGGFRSGIVMTLHDALYVEAPDEEVEEVKRIVEEEMTRPIPYTDLSLPVEIKVSDRWI